MNQEMQEGQEPSYLDDKANSFPFQGVAAFCILGWTGT